MTAAQPSLSCPSSPAMHLVLFSKEIHVKKLSLCHIPTGKLMVCSIEIIIHKFFFWIEGEG